MNQKSYERTIYSICNVTVTPEDERVKIQNPNTNKTKRASLLPGK